MNMGKIKSAVNEMFIIATCMVIGLGIQETLIHFSTNMKSFETPWYIPLTIPIAAFLCALPSSLINDCDELSKWKTVFRVVLHYLCLFIIVTGCGFAFSWYSDESGYLVVILVFTMIYTMVWLISWWLEKRDENIINSALKSMQDKE